jgi:hypothetical protein
VIDANHGTHVLGVELGRERSRANEVGEHHGSAGGARRGLAGLARSPRVPKRP